MSQTESVRRRPLRLWPGVAIVAVQWLVRYVMPLVLPETLLYAVFGGLIAGLAVIVWWAFFSRAPRLDRLGGVLVLVAALFAARPILDKSIATGMMGFLFPIYSIPILCLAFVLWAILTQRLGDVPRRVSMVVTVALVCAGWALVRTNGMTGDAVSDFAWRWSRTREQEFVAQANAQPVVPPPEPAVAAEPPAAPKPKEAPAPVAAVAPAPVTRTAEWPGFRGPGRDSVIRGLQINTDWTTTKPAELWRRPIGPGWSSFAVSGNLLYTQEQRGDDEVVACYSATTGKPVWIHKDAARFWESNAGPGPRGTPTLHDGRAYTFGATGILNALAASNGKVIWSRNASKDTGVKIPGWGFASSPLVWKDLVIVATSGTLAAYDKEAGAPRWHGAAAGGGYSSPQLYEIGGIPQVLLMGAKSVISVAPSDGSLLWKFDWPANTRIVQPGRTADGDLLISGDEANGIKRISAVHGANGWTVEEKWASLALKPYFNDFVVYEDHAYGFDGSIMACVDVKDGKRVWKGGRYGHGQVVLLQDQGVLLVLSEEGEIVLVKASPSQFTELARVPALDGKTWNHPVIVKDRLFVRNGSEMVAFRLPVAGV